MPHTPGPWKYMHHPLHQLSNDTNARRFHVYRIAPSGHTEGIANTANDEWSVSPKNHEANAWLIAAAPELLEALIEAEHAITRQIYRDDFPDDDKHPLAKTQKMLRATIAKAEGKATW